MPSVRNLMQVAALVSSINRTLQPTSRPHWTPSSSATRRETDSAAKRRGWVHAIRPAKPRPAARHILGIWVDLPDPVSPARITTWFSWIAAVISSARAVIGSSGGNSTRNGNDKGRGINSPIAYQEISRPPIARLFSIAVDAGGFIGWRNERRKG